MKHTYKYSALLLLIGLIIGNSSGCKPEPVLQWSKSFNDVIIYSITQTKDGGYILCGGKHSDENTDESSAWLMKTDADGNKLWEKTYSDVTACPSSLWQTADGGYMLCGNTFIKTDSEGNKLWEKIIENGGGWMKSIQQTTDGGFIICGASGDFHLVLAKTDTGGNIIWNKVFTISEMDEGNSVRQTTDGGYIVCGNTWPIQKEGFIDRPNILLIKTDANGNKMWEKTPGGTLYNSGVSVQQTADNGYIVCGTGDTKASVGILGILLIKTDASGNKLWEKVFKQGQGYSVQLTDDGGYIICGTSDSFGIPRHCWLIKTDANGHKLWDKTFGEGITYCGSVQQTADGGYITCGQIHIQFSDTSLLSKIARFP